MAWRLLMCCLCGLLLSVAGLADTLVVAGRAAESPAPFITEGGEVLAPLGAALRPLGARVSQLGPNIELTTRDGRAYRLHDGDVLAQVDGRALRLPAAPRLVNEVLYLPAYTVAPWLGVAAAFDAKTRTLTLAPHVQLTVQPEDDRVVVLARSTGALEFTSSALDKPVRLYADFVHAACEPREQTIPVGKCGVERVRLAQAAKEPGAVRLVVDGAADLQWTSTVSEGGRLATFTIAKRPVPVVVPVRLTGASLTARGESVTELALQADGALESTVTAEGRTLTVSLPEATSALPAAGLRVTRDPVVMKCDITTKAGEPGVTLTFALKRESGYQLQRGAKGLRLLIGAFDLDDMVLVLDAGHGGKDSGAVGRRQATMEKDANLDIVLRATELLRAAGATVYLTREGDTYPTLEERPALVAETGAHLFISVHNNSCDNAAVGGTQTYYYKPQSATLAECMQEELYQAVGLRNAGLFNNRGFVVINRTAEPSVLLEVAFLSNAKEEGLLRDPNFRQKAAEGILNGLRRYAGTTDWQLRRAEAPAAL